MTQRRGLGRGLGALIPGAGASAPEKSAMQESAATASPAEDDAPSLRTRRTSAPAPEDSQVDPADSPAGSNSRPVDMFFSGEPAGDTAESRSSRRSTRADLAGDMARAASERRSTTRRRASSSAADDGSSTEDEQKKAPAKRSAGGTTSTAKKPAARSAAKSSGAKGRSTQGSAVKGGAAKSSTGPSASATESSGPAQGSTAKGSGARVGATATGPTTSKATTTGTAKTGAGKGRAKMSGSSAQSTTSRSSGSSQASEPATPPREDSPAVDIEKVEYTPVDRATAGPGASSAVSETATSPDPSEVRDPEVRDPEVTEDQEQSTSEAAESEGLRSGTQGLMQVPGAEFAEIPIHEIRENPRNPRTVFEDDALDELAFSLREVGVLQPVVVRPISVTDDGESFELVMGERRWRAAQRAGLSSIPAIIRETSDDDLLRDALLENLHRTQLNPLEEAAAYQQLLEDFGITQDELSARIGRSRPQISNTLRLMRLPALVQRRLASGALSAGHARALLTLEQPKLMEELAARIVAEGLSVRAVEKLVSRGIEPGAKTPSPRRSSYDPRVVDFTSRLSNRFEAPVRIDVGKRKGRITMEFTNLEDLERLVEALGIESSDGDEHSATE